MATLTNSSRMHEIDERVWSKRSAASGDVAHKSPKQHCSTGGSRRRKTIHSACPVRCREMKPAAGPVRRSASSVAMPPRRHLSGESLDRTAPCPSRLERRRQQRAHRSSLSQRCTPIMPRGCPRASSPTARDPPYTRSSRLSKRPVISATTTADTAKTSASNSMHSTKKCRSQRTRRSTQSVLYTPLQGGNAQQSTEDSFTTPSAASTTRRSTTVDPMAPQHCCSMMAPSAESFPVSARASLDGATRAATVFSTALAADEEAFFRRLYGSISTEEGGKTSHFVVRTSTADVDTVAGDDADEGEDCVVVADPASEGDVDEENWQFTDPSPGDVEEPTATQVLCTPARQMVHHHRHVVSSSEVPSTPAVSEPGTMLFKDRRYCAGRADDSYRYSHSLCGPTSYHTEQRGCTWASLQADDPLPSCAAPLSSSGCVDFLVQASEDAHPAGLHHSHPDSWLFSCEDMKMVPTVVYSSRTPVVRLRKMSSDGSFLPGSSHEKDALERSGKSSEAVAHISTRFYSETHSEDSHMKQVMECRMDAAVACAMAAYPASAVAAWEDCSPPHLPFGAADVKVPAQEAETVEDIASWVHVLLRYRDRQNAYPMDESSASLFSVPSRELFSPAVENLRAVIADKKFRHAESTKNVSAFSPLFTRW